MVTPKQLMQRPLYVELSGDKARVDENDKAFVRLDGDKEFSSKFEVGNSTLFDILLHGKMITEAEYNK